MTDISPETGRPASLTPDNPMLARLASGTWVLAVVSGGISLLLGLAVLAWPRQTIGVLALLVGLHLLFHGVYRVAQAIVSGGDGGTRVLLALLGVLSIALGVLALRHLFQTVQAITLIFGLFWLVGGLIEIVGTLVQRPRSGVGAQLALGVAAVLVGIFVLVFPEASLKLLVWTAGIWFLTWGLVTVLVALWIRHSIKKADVGR